MQIVIDIKDYDREWITNGYYIPNEINGKIAEAIINGAPLPGLGHWSRKTKVDAYDIEGVKTWGIKCQCDRCTFTTIVVEDFGYYSYCPNCGAKMFEPQESEEKK